MKTKLPSPKFSSKTLFFLSLLFSFLLNNSTLRSQCNISLNYTLGPSGSVLFDADTTNVSQLLIWNFGDNTNDYGITNPTHTYPYSGSYIVFLDGGCGDTGRVNVTDTIHISSAPCGISANFYTYQDSAVASTWSCYPTYIPRLNAQATWTWGDGTASNGLYPTHTYTAPGIYQICVTATTACGATDTQCHSIYISAANTSTMEVVGPKITGLETNSRNELEGAQVYPNPSSEQAFLKLDVTLSETYNLRISDISGRVLSSVEIKTEPGLNTIPLETTELNPGVYFISLSNGTHLKTLRLIKH